MFAANELGSNHYEIHVDHAGVHDFMVWLEEGPSPVILNFTTGTQVRLNNDHEVATFVTGFLSSYEAMLAVRDRPPVYLDHASHPRITGCGLAVESIQERWRKRDTDDMILTDTPGLQRCELDAVWTWTRRNM